jgi:hypothetical protein
MSKLRTPHAKKEASLTRDRRTAPGESSKAARKSIPRAKAQARRANRRAVHQALVGADPEPLVERAETAAAEADKDRKARGFRKQPEKPLGEVVAEKLQRRKR